MEWWSLGVPLKGKGAGSMALPSWPSPTLRPLLDSAATMNPRGRCPPQWEQWPVHTSERAGGLGPAPQTGLAQVPAPACPSQATVTSSLQASVSFSTEQEALWYRLGVFVKIKCVHAFRGAWRTHGKHSTSLALII